MERIGPNDLVDVYIIIKEEIPRGLTVKKSIIKGWTFEKICAETYLEIHKHPDMHIRHERDYYSNIKAKLSEYMNCQISISILQIKHPKTGKLINVGCPITTNEGQQINTEIDSACSGLIPYSRIWDKIFYLKDKYQEALNGIFFSECREISRNKPNKLAKDLKYDHMSLMLRLFPGDFGE